MKKGIALLLTAVLLFSVASCGKAKNEDPFIEETVLFDVNTPTLPVESGTTPAESETVQEPVVTASEPMKIVQAAGYAFPDVAGVYAPAQKIYRDLTVGNVEIDEDLGAFELEKDGSKGVFYRTNDPRFDSVAELEEYLSHFFTADCIALFYDKTRFNDYEGHLYAMRASEPDTYLFAGSSYTLNKQTTMRIFFTMTAYYFKSAELRPAHYTVFEVQPADTSVYDTREVPFVLEKKENGENVEWKFSLFGNVG